MSSVIGVRHPVGLWALCALELFERFAASLLGSLLLLYLNERIGMSLGTATRWSGSFNAMVYLSSVLGGIAADRVLGARLSIRAGRDFACSRVRGAVFRCCATALSCRCLARRGSCAVQAEHQRGSREAV